MSGGDRHHPSLKEVICDLGILLGGVLPAEYERGYVPMPRSRSLLTSLAPDHKLRAARGRVRTWIGRSYDQIPALRRRKATSGAKYSMRTGELYPPNLVRART